MTDQMLEQLTCKALKVILIAHYGHEDQYFKDMLGVIKLAVLEGKIEAYKEAGQFISSSKNLEKKNAYTRLPFM